MAVNHTSTGVRLIGAYFILSALAFGTVGLGAMDKGIGQFALVVALAMFLVGFGLLDGRDWGFTGGILGAFLAFVVNSEPHDIAVEPEGRVEIADCERNAADVRFCRQ